MWTAHPFAGGRTSTHVFVEEPSRGIPHSIRRESNHLPRAAKKHSWDAAARLACGWAAAVHERLARRAPPVLERQQSNVVLRCSAKVQGNGSASTGILNGVPKEQLHATHRVKDGIRRTVLVHHDVSVVQRDHRRNSFTSYARQPNLQ